MYRRPCGLVEDRAGLRGRDSRAVGLWGIVVLEVLWPT